MVWESKYCRKINKKKNFSSVGKSSERNLVQEINEDHPDRTIYRTIAECEQGIPCLNLPKSGRPRVFTAQREERLVGRARNQVGMSSRRLARRYDTTKSTVSLTLKRNGLKYRKRRKCPKYTQGQLLRIPRCCRQLRRVYFADGKSIILDDEKYFTLANSEMKGNYGFYTNNLEECLTI
ncbi:hypothetical protein NQ318_018507 [Aromia moschata]|uniref:Transposase IS30-like HTH domain-containing protein n=1 Tax=Aromia moschata TaxID=1265417 RepID=A0AAV8ZFH2_9CUCU|nr:hypothetical protein NQ318_018507 [Aromia moschata]